MILLPLCLTSTDFLHDHSSVPCPILSYFLAYAEVRLIQFSAIFLNEINSSIICQQIHAGAYVIFPRLVQNYYSTTIRFWASAF